MINSDYLRSSVLYDSYDSYHTYVSELSTNLSSRFTKFILFDKSFDLSGSKLLFRLFKIMSSLTFSDIVRSDWSSLPFDLILSILSGVPGSDVVRLCLHNDSFNRRVCQHQDSIIWKMLFQRDISERVPRDHIASQYLDIMDKISSFDSQQRLNYGAVHGYDEIVKAALQDGANIHSWHDAALRWAALNGNTETVKLLLDRSADINAENDEALRSDSTEWTYRNS